MKKLIEIQAELKAPKNQRNTFGKYNYRSCEDILEAVKPLLKKHKIVMTLSDEVRDVCGAAYVETTCRISDGETSIETSGQAGIEKQGGMSLPQAFGSAASYSAKRALGNMFLIDDTKDADATNDHGGKPKLTEPILQKVVKAIFEGKGTIEQAKSKYDISERQEEQIKAMIQAKG